MGGNIQGSFVPIKKKNRNYRNLSLSIYRSTFLMKRILVLCDLFPCMFYVISGNVYLEYKQLTYFRRAV